MADALISNVLNSLNTFLHGELGHGLGVDVSNELKNLSFTLTAIQPLLHDAGTQQLGNSSVRDWPCMLRDVAYDLDYILDQCRTLHLTSKLNEDYKVCNFSSSPALSFFNQTEPCDSLACRGKEVRERLDSVWDEKNRYPFDQFDWVESPIDHGSEPASLAEKSEIYGRNENKEMIISKFVGEGSICSEDRGIHVLCVVGMKGIGKTTRAQSIYNDERVNTHFTKRIWASAYEDFNVTSLTQKIIETARGQRLPLCYISQLNVLQSILREVLVEERTLLVLEDACGEDRTEWERLVLPFKSGDHGSKILVATYSEKVASAIGTNQTHHLEGLSDNDWWSLFSGRAFSGRERGDLLELENIGKKNCKQV